MLKQNSCSTEIQLFLLWGNARHKESEIIEEIKTQFEIVEMYEISWDKKIFKQNLERFYCEKIRGKIKHTGTDKFLLVTIRDKSPQYEYMQTLKGYELVNSKILTLKKKFRKLTGGGYKIHSTNDIGEVDKNLVFLINKSYKDYYAQTLDKVWDEKDGYIKITDQPRGTNGWENFEDIFYLLNSSCKYVVLRGLDASDGDIDLLVDDYKSIKYLLNGEFIKKNKYKSKLEITVSNKKYVLDLRYVGDNYYCEKWEEDILNNRIFLSEGYYVPSQADFFYSLIYHILFHKKVPSRKYDEMLEKILPNFYSGGFESGQDNHNLYLKLLWKFMYENDYFPVKPKDRKVKYNPYQIRRMWWLHKLEKYGFENISTLGVNKKPTSDFEFFFIANKDGKKIFIKCGNGDTYAKKEYEVCQVLYAQNQKHFPQAYMYRNLEDNKMFVAMDYIEGCTLKNLDYSKLPNNVLNNIFDSLYNIGQILFKNKFIHRDFHYENLIVEPDGNVKLIDFQHLLGNHFDEDELNIKNPKRLRGTNKRLRPAPYVWDDMYSIYKMMQKFPKDKIENYDEKFSDIQSKVGKQRYYFLDRKFKLKAYFNLKMLVVYKLINTIWKPFRKLLRK